MSGRLADNITYFARALREAGMRLGPGSVLDAVALDPKLVSDTLGVLLKYQDDIQKMQGSDIAKMLSEIGKG